MITSVIGWIVFGLVAGASRECCTLAMRGWAGAGRSSWAFVARCSAGGIAYLLRLGTSPYEPAGWIFSIIGAIVLLAMGFFAPQAVRMTQQSFKPIVEPRQQTPSDFRGLEQLAWLMDRAIKIPGRRSPSARRPARALADRGRRPDGADPDGIVLVRAVPLSRTAAVAARMVANVLLDTALGRFPSWVMLSMSFSKPTRATSSSSARPGGAHAAPRGHVLAIVGLARLPRLGPARNARAPDHRLLSRSSPGCSIGRFV